MVNVQVHVHDEKNLAATGGWRHTLGEGQSTLKPGLETLLRDHSPWVTHNGPLGLEYSADPQPSLRCSNAAMRRDTCALPGNRSLFFAVMP